MRLVCALMVVTMSVLFAPVSRPAALVIASLAAAFSAYSLPAAGRWRGGGDPLLSAGMSLAVDGAFALATYLLFMRDPRAMPAAFVPLLVFELAARFAGAGVLAATLVMAAAIGGRVFAQAALLPGGAVRPAMLMLWLAVGVLMAVFGREFRAHQRHYLAVMHERGRIAESFRATAEQVLARYGVHPGSATFSEVEQALGEICSESSPERQQLTARLAELIATARDDLGLTRREQEIATLLARGYSCGRIAAELRVSQSTVRNHIHNIKTRLGLDSREQIIALLRGEPLHSWTRARPRGPAKARRRAEPAALDGTGATAPSAVAAQSRIE